jgi:pimeloyl-ACP methyl ester carboxylesterase
LFFRERGKGPLLLILPGNTASSANHESELRYFGDRFHVASPDFLGTGGSERVGEWADAWWQQGAQQAHALVQHLGYRQAIVMGTSGGAVAALWTALLFPQAVRAVIADSCMEVFSEEMLRENVYRDRAQRTPEKVAFWEQAHGADWEQVIEADTDMMRRFAESGGAWFKKRLSEIGCPVLLTASRRDPLLPQVVHQVCAMAEQIVRSRVFLNDAGGHPLMWSCPQTFRGICDVFVTELEEG